MATGVLTLQSPSDLFTKLLFEISQLDRRPANAYSVINAIRDGYHLRDWIWHAYLKSSPALQAIVTGAPCTEQGWGEWVNRRVPHFSVLRDLTIGSKHMVAEIGGRVVGGTGRAHRDAAIWDVEKCDEPFRVVLDDGQHVFVILLLREVEKFWRGLMQGHGWL